MLYMKTVFHFYSMEMELQRKNIINVTGHSRLQLETAYIWHMSLVHIS